MVDQPDYLLCHFMFVAHGGEQAGLMWDDVFGDAAGAKANNGCASGHRLEAGLGLVVFARR